MGLTLIPVTRRVKGYTIAVGKYVTGRRKRLRPHVGKYVTGKRKRFGPHKIYIFLKGSRLSVCPSVRMNSKFSETVRARMLKFGMKIHRHRFVSAGCHALIF